MKREFGRLSEGPFDLLVIGGGIVGCSIARDAARRGLRTALVEKGDFASGTSSRTSKLIHGGLRYLEHGYMHLVRESVREREILLRLAPHLVRPLHFFLPYEPSSGWPPYPFLRTGLYLYDLFAGRERVGGFHRGVALGEMLESEPALAGNGRVTRGAAYWDAQMNDSRLTLENALDAAESGAVLVNHAEAVSFELRSDGGIRAVEVADRLDGKSARVEARLFINAAGPWGDILLNRAGRVGKPILGPSKGIHLVYGEKTVDHGFILRSRLDRRVFFVLPWQGLTLIGTTETPAPEDPGEAKASPEDVSYLLESAAEALPGARFEKGKVRAVFAGIRPLLASGKSILSSASREHSIAEGPAGLISVLGGKFTTYRSMACAAVDFIQRRLGRRPSPCPTLVSPLPGARPSQSPPARAYEGAAERLREIYGSRSEEVLKAAEKVPDGLSPLCPHTAHLKAEVYYAAECEMAMSVSDVLERRLGVAQTAECGGRDAAEAASRIIASAHQRSESWAAESAGNFLARLSGQPGL